LIYPTNSKSIFVFPVLNCRVFAILVVLFVPLAAQSQEMCRYPIIAEAHDFTVVDITGYDNPDIKSMLEGKSPTINCQALPGKLPTCSTPWGGRVYIDQCESNRICIEAIQDREARMVDFRNLFRTGQLQFTYINDSKQGFGVYACGQPESLGVRIGEWVSLETELVGGMFNRLTYKIGTETRIFNAKKQWKVIYGAPSSVAAGNRGSF